ncbi:anti-sigma-D factor RsdA [Saccharothrix coeruleofusca]|uniref:Anti-sigma-D factor RsdA sigma factor binding region domain-containing protein n=1 Tax=Saccharothrix coeruleofusca TaxID=33919 RepID=A0A918AMS5_9PSEU|nr:anti-sigma-D factor RsdA [Saccharothrix coeruleofusca]MBP2339323.1 hypothetical protein [Saccharothrix coeruleofusca]GGP58555.1 hypothetical protein GCM10010185_33770 [Saccharothrix coeruleofusca]
MADQHEKGNGEIVRGKDGRPPLTSDDPAVEPGDDLAGIRADDALLDALGGRAGEQPDSLADDELNALLLAWRREVDSRPVGELVDTDTAVATIAAARPVPRRHRFLIPLASAAAVLAIAFTGVSLVARDARPGDTLWGLTRVLYSDHARSVEAAVAVRTDLDTARAALREGKLEEARDALLKAGIALPEVSTDDGKEALVETHESLLEELTSTPAPAGTPSAGAPAPTTTTLAQSTTLPTTTEPTKATTEPSTAPPPTTTTEQSGQVTEEPPPPALPTTGGESRGQAEKPATETNSETAAS